MGVLFVRKIWLALALACLGASGCGLIRVKKPVAVPTLLEPRADADTPQLIAEVNRLAALRSVKAKVYFQFEDTSFAASGVADKYSQADGTIYVQRPGQIYLAIQGPLSVKIAEMTSDGQTFRVAVYQGDPSLRNYVKGTNNVNYSAMVKAMSAKPMAQKSALKDTKTVSVFSNLRPQHFTEALLLSPVKPRSETGYLYAQSEVFEEEADTRPNAKKSARVVRGYYLLDELAAKDDGSLQPVRRFWFDRVGGIRLARLQEFQPDGRIASDITYEQPGAVSADGAQLPTRMEITRPLDKYKLSFYYKEPLEVVLNKEYDPAIFVLDNKTNLTEIDLDKKLQEFLQKGTPPAL
jgi:hypothetical protein